MNRNPIIIWREVMPDVEKGVFSYISKQWGNVVKCYYLNNQLSERLDCGWDQHSYANVQVEKIPNDTNPLVFVKEINNENPDALHVFFGGLRHSLKRYLDAYLHVEMHRKIIVIAEKPLVSGHFAFLRNVSKKVLYKNILRKYQSNIDIFLAMGQKGVERYKEYGYTKQSIYPFMYNPIISDENVRLLSIDDVLVNKPLRFLYLGRFDYKYKGCDYMMKAFDSINPQLSDKWELTLVGGYGNQTNEMIEWANKKNNVKFDGKWTQSEIVKKMATFDICLVPSKEDGWNLTPNYAIHSHIATISSNQATSHELIENSGAGLVYNSKDIKELQKNIELAIKNKDIVLHWKQKTFAYKKNISPEAVGNYFIDIIDYTFYDSSKRPICPWLLQNN